MSGYRSAFVGGEALRPFVVYHRVGADKRLSARCLTRSDFWRDARRAAALLQAHGLQKGDIQLHFFSRNSLADLVFRLAAAIVGSVPATVNWQADTTERVLYKARLTRTRLVLVDEGTPDESVAALKAELPHLLVVDAAAAIEGATPLEEAELSAVSPHDEDSRMVIFTSGTTGAPKGVRLPFRAYEANRATFEAFLHAEEPSRPLVCVVVNPLHHTNSTAICDWAMRRPGALIHLVERYTTAYWDLLARVGTPLAPTLPGSEPPLDVGVKEWTAALEARAAANPLILAPLVSRHVDFLHELMGEVATPPDGAQGSLAPPADVLRRALSGTVLLLGSAPVGPTTVERLQEYAANLPTVRFGSTETCLQVMGTPLHLSKDAMLRAFRAGWDHRFGEAETSGYWIGSKRSQPSSGYMVECSEGEPGYIITRGAHVMSGYVGDDAATAAAIDEDGWYTNLGDVGFWLTSQADGERDFYWRARDSALLIKGGANYSYEQINTELTSFLHRHYELAAGSAAVAVVGLRVASEHEDECCATIELLTPEAEALRTEIEKTFISDCSKGVTKGSKPDRIRIASIPRNFKGAIQVPALKAAWDVEILPKKRATS